MDKIKVLIIAGSMDVGGIENQLMHLLRNADKNRFQIDFTSTMEHAYYKDEIESLGGKYIKIPSMNWRYPLPYCRALYKIMKHGEYDIVHSHELFHSGIVMTIAYYAGIKGRFVHAHNWADGDGSGRKRSFVRSVYNAVMRKLILKYSNRQMACSTLAGKFLYGDKIITKDSYHLIFNSVDTSKFLEKYSQTEQGEFCNDGWINVIQVGRVTPVKNQLFLVRVAAVLRKRGEKIRILCAGNGDSNYVEKVKKCIEKHHLDSHIKMLGVRSDIDSLMRKSNAFVLPSLYEGMPLVLIEAQASGLPCVVADTFSHEVDFELNLVKWMQLDDGPAVWADAIQKAVQTSRAEKCSVIETITEKRFDSKLFAETMCNLYEEALRGNGVND